MTWNIDAAHSRIGFTVKHMMISTVRGQFNKFSGTIDGDIENPTAAKVNVTIDVASINTSHPDRDNHLRTADFFDVEHYPTATFTSTKIEKLSDEKYKVTGDLTIHGVTRSVTLDAAVEGPIKDMQGNRRAGLTLTTAFSRKDFGLSWNVALEAGGFIVSDNVSINIDAEVVETADVPAAATAKA